MYFMNNEKGIIGRKYNVLDHGFIRVVDVMGDDTAIVDAARVSYGQGTKPMRQNRALINYLLSHRHTSPFEQCEIKLHLKMPIFVARQWLRHRTANVNEYSARYSTMRDEFYIPEIKNILAQSGSNKQGREGDLPLQNALSIQHDMMQLSTNAYSTYHNMLDMGLSREVARIILPLNIYTEFYWKCDLHNLLHFIRLRADKHAQYEIRAYAELMLAIVKDWVPFTYDAFMDYSLDSLVLSSKASTIVRDGLSNNPTTKLKKSNYIDTITPREWDEMLHPLLRSNT